MSFASVHQTRLGEYLVEMVLVVLQWSWPWSWTACTAAFATLASTQTLSWSTPRERGGSPSLISRATLLLSVLALYSCSMEKSINGWVERKESCVFRPPLSAPFFLDLSPPRLTSCLVSLELSSPLPHFWVVPKDRSSWVKHFGTLYRICLLLFTKLISSILVAKNSLSSCELHGRKTIQNKTKEHFLKFKPDLKCLPSSESVKKTVTVGSKRTRTVYQLSVTGRWRPIIDYSVEAREV